MKRILRCATVILMGELFQQCLGYRVDWHKLLLIGAIMTISGVIFQMLTLTYPLNNGFLSQPETVTPYNSLNGTIQLGEVLKVARVEPVQLIPAAPVSSLNSSTKLIHSVPPEPERVEDPPRKKSVSRRRKKKSKLDEKPTPPPPPPPHRIVPLRLQRYIWSLPPNEALLYAKKEIEHVPLVADDPDLYASLFRNVSVFKRSYKMMELMLKVYIYRDGKRPIFHQPHLKGIYASEGWFMKLIEENRQFVTRDPEKAHLFYLPYSARQLEMALYVPESHNLKPLSLYLRDYVNYIAGKYPFWNRTHGSDHFLVACHDWVW